MNRYLNDIMRTPIKESSLLSAEPAVVEALSWLTQIGTEDDNGTSDSRFNVLVNRGKGTELAVLSDMHTEGFTLTFKNKDIIKIDGSSASSGTDVYFRTSGAMGDVPIWSETLVVHPLIESTGQHSFELALAIADSEVEPLKNYFGSSYGTCGNTSDGAVRGITTTQSAITTAADLTKERFNGAVKTYTVDEYDQLITGPISLYAAVPATGHPSSPANHLTEMWRVSLSSGVVTFVFVESKATSEINNDTYRLFPVEALSFSCRLPEGAYRVSGAFTFDGVPVVCYQTKDAIYVSTYYESGEVHTSTLLEEAVYGKLREDSYRDTVLFSLEFGESYIEPSEVTIDVIEIVGVGNATT